MAGMIAQRSTTKIELESSLNAGADGLREGQCGRVVLGCWGVAVWWEGCDRALRRDHLQWLSLAQKRAVDRGETMGMGRPVLVLEAMQCGRVAAESPAGGHECVLSQRPDQKKQNKINMQKRLQELRRRQVELGEDRSGPRVEEESSPWEVQLTRAVDV